MGQHFKIRALLCITIRLQLVLQNSLKPAKWFRLGTWAAVGRKGMGNIPFFLNTIFPQPLNRFPQVGMLIVIMVVSTILRLCPQLKIFKYKHYDLLEKFNNFVKMGVDFCETNPCFGIWGAQNGHFHRVDIDH